MELIGLSEFNQASLSINKDNYDIKDSTKISNTPMGDFDYEDIVHPLSSDCSSSDFSDEIELNSFYDAKERLIDTLAKQIEELREEVSNMINRIDYTEEDILKRRDFYRDIEKVNLECGKQIGREIEQIEKMEFLIDQLQTSMSCRDESLENMKVVENTQICDHFRKRTESDSSFYRESDVFGSAEC